MWPEYYNKETIIKYAEFDAVIFFSHRVMSIRFLYSIQQLHIIDVANQLCLIKTLCDYFVFYLSTAS